MSVFLSCFLGCLLAFAVFALCFCFLMVVAVVEYKKKQQRDLEKAFDSFNNVKVSDEEVKDLMNSL